MYLFDCRRKQSFPVFWILESLGGLGFVFMGGCIIHAYVGNIFLERFAVRKNRIVNKAQVIKAIEMLYSSQSLTEVVRSLPFVDSTEETNRLIEKDAYILPSVPLSFPKKQKDRDRAIREKEEREKRAMQVLTDI